MSSAESEVSCPTPPGLSTGGFDPGIDWSYVKSDPTANWHVIGWLVCLLFIFINWVVSLTVVVKHLRNYYEPQIQRHKLRVLLFPPVYATLAWFAYLRFDYSTTIMFFAVVFEAFAVFNLFETLQAYLAPFRVEAADMKEPIDTKVMFIFKLHLPSKWGMHYRIITDILVYQYPIWSLLDSFMSIFAELKGRYCEGAYSFKGAYVYLTIINFTSLSIILTALFTYLDVFHREWLRGHVKAHGMFWCVKGPIMINFYFGEILLSILSTKGVIKGTDGSHGSIAWSVDAVKNGISTIIICVVMMVDSFMMLRFFGPADNIQSAAKTGQTKKMSAWGAFVDGYLAYIPEFIHTFLCCGFDSYRLMKKRRALRKKKKMAAIHGPNPTDHLIDDNVPENTTVNNNAYNLSEMGENGLNLTQKPIYHSQSEYSPPDYSNQPTRAPNPFHGGSS